MAGLMFVTGTLHEQCKDDGTVIMLSQLIHISTSLRDISFVIYTLLCN